MDSQYDFLDTGGHGYLVVSRHELVELGIDELISGYSYECGDTVYLEEDGDLDTFAKAKGKFGHRTRHVSIDYMNRFVHYLPK